ncbi:hypothetical protein [Nocardia abscessus]|uniref:hypothetical protein n=1 Tax=Nocardia abscessus TaxID=120957 RepID=UPI00245811E1|nr:hypothetical protein [Nocardia abscessus]
MTAAMLRWCGCTWSAPATPPDRCSGRPSTAAGDGVRPELFNSWLSVRAFLSAIADLAPATRKRKRAAVAAFCRWAVRHDLLAANPMDKVDTITVPKTLPRLRRRSPRRCRRRRARRSR